MPWSKVNGRYYENEPRVMPGTLRTKAQQERCKGKPCEPGCLCGKHNRTRQHNELISRGVKRHAQAARMQVLRQEAEGGAAR